MMSYGTNQRGWERSQFDVFFLQMFGTSVGPEWSLGRGQLAVPGHKSPRQSKNVIHTSWPHLDDQVEAFQVGVISGILNFEVALRLIHTNSKCVTLFYYFILGYPLFFSFRNTSWLVPKHFWKLSNINFRKQFFSWIWPPLAIISL